MARPKKANFEVKEEENIASNNPVIEQEKPVEIKKFVYQATGKFYADGKKIISPDGKVLGTEESEEIAQSKARRFNG